MVQELVERLQALLRLGAEAPDSIASRQLAWFILRRRKVRRDMHSCATHRGPKPALRQAEVRFLHLQLPRVEGRWITGNT